MGLIFCRNSHCTFIKGNDEYAICVYRMLLYALGFLSRLAFDMGEDFDLWCSHEHGMITRIDSLCVIFLEFVMERT